MALESFYGGKQGVSPVIKAKFKYINTEDPAYDNRWHNNITKLTGEEALTLNAFFNTNEYQKDQSVDWQSTKLKNEKQVSILTPFIMDECLKRTDYTEVWYGELCIIDTDNKLNPNNGKLFRRTLKQTGNRYLGTEDTLYAEYIGQIVGPSGAIPNFDFGSLDAERQKAVGKKKTYNDETEPLDNSNWDYRYPRKSDGYITNNTPSKYSDIKVLDSGNIAINNTNSANIQMVPGKKDLTGSNEDDNNFNDRIRYTWCNVRRRLEDKEDDAWIYLGFEIPYTVYDIIAVDEDYTYGADTENDKIVVDLSNPDHPFFKQYSFHIPRGARGIGPEQIFIVGKDGQTRPDILLNFDAIKYRAPGDAAVQGIDLSDPNFSTYSVPFDNYYIKKGTHQIPNNSLGGSTYWVAKWVLYNPRTTKKFEVYQFLGSYKDINAIQLLQNGKLQIQYSNSENWYDLRTLTWITNVSVNTNKDDSDYGQIKIDFNNNQISNIDENLHLIKDVFYTDNTGKFTFAYSDKKDTDINITTETPIEYIKYFTINTDKTDSNYGKIDGHTNLGKVDSTHSKKLPLIKDIVYNSNDRMMTFYYSGLENGITIGPIQLEYDGSAEQVQQYVFIKEGNNYIPTDTDTNAMIAFNNYNTDPSVDEDILMPWNNQLSQS